MVFFNKIISKIAILFAYQFIMSVHIVSTYAYAQEATCSGYLNQVNEDEILLNVLKGARIFKQNDGLQAPLDQTTVSNLELDKLVLKPIMEMAPTSLGRQRIKHLIQNPSLDVEYIKDRQAALRELMANVRLSDDIYGLMKGVETKDNCLMDLDPDFRSGGGINLGNALLGTAMTGSFCAIGIASMAVIGDVRMGALFIIKGGLIQLILPNEERHKSAKKILNQGKKIASLLKDSKSKELQNIYEILNSLNQAEDPFGMKSVLNGLNRLAPSEVNRYLQSFTHATSLTRYFGYKKVRKWKKNLALYFSAWAELEAYITAAQFLKTHQNEMIIPEILDQELAFLDINNGHHPYHFFTKNSLSQENSVQLDSEPNNDEAKTYIVTGPNAGGKTTYLRMISLNILLAQAGFPVAAQSMVLTPMQVATNFTVIDNTHIGHSTFMSQSVRVREVFDLISNGRPTFIALDEVLNGTSQREHNAAEHAVLEELHKEPNTLLMLATHDRTLTELSDTLPKVENRQVSLQGFQILPGPSTIYNADAVMQRAGVPQRVLDNMRDRLNKH